MSAETGLADAAFGDDPGPLATARGDQRRISCGFARSQQEARVVTPARWPTWRACTASRPRGPLASLAHSTRASFLRQLGWHARARRWDGRAVALAGEDSEAGADALIGLAADALGVGRFPASAAALARAADLLTGAAPARLPVRLAWVSAELAMARGDGATAVGHGQRAVGLGCAARLGSPHPQVGRHCGRSAVQRRRARAGAPHRRRRARTLRRFGHDPIALGVGITAGRHRQRESLNCGGGCHPRRGGRYSAAPRRRVVGPVTGFTPL